MLYPSAQLEALRNVEKILEKNSGLNRFEILPTFLEEKKTCFKDENRKSIKRYEKF